MIFKKIHKEQNKTVLIVTHDEKIAKQCEGIINIVDGKIVKKSYYPHDEVLMNIKKDFGQRIKE